MKASRAIAIAAVVGAPLLLAAKPSSAGDYEDFNGYVCQIKVLSTNYPAAPFVTLYSQPDCAGTFVGTVNTYSIDGNTYPEQTDRLYQGFLSALISDSRVNGTWFTTSLWGYTLHFADTLYINAN